MPTVLLEGPYRFFFYAADGCEPPHVHVRRDRAKAKFWLDPVGLVASRHFSPHELAKIQKVVKENASQFRREWDEYFGG